MRYEAVILATGFTAALAPLGHMVHTDEKGFAIRRDRVASAEHDGLYFVGHNYDATGGPFNIARDSRLVADAIARENARLRAPRPITEHSHTP